MKLRLLLAPAIAAACIATLAPAANAQVYRHHDPVGDMATYDDSNDSYVAAPATHNGDVVRSTISHSGKSVTMTIAMRELTRTPGELVEFVYILRDSHGKTSLMMVEAGPGMWRGDSMFIRLTKKSGECKGAWHHIYYGAKKVKVVIPRRCLGNPAWVRGTSAVDRLVDPTGDFDYRALDRASAERMLRTLRGVRIGTTARGGDVQEFVDLSHSRVVDDRYHWSPRLRHG